MEYDPRITLDVFNAPTTYLNDYCKYEPQQRKLYYWPKDRYEIPERDPPPEIPIDNNTFQKLRPNVHIPFNLFWEPKPITGTIPQQKFTLPPKPVDDGREEAQRTRPRIYMSPALSIDDIEDPEMRKLMCAYMYTSEWGKASREAAGMVTQKPVANTTVEKGGDPVKYEFDEYPPLPLGWREKAKPWDVIQTRACVDPTRTFWIHKDPPMKCGACVDPLANVVSQEVKQEIAGLVKKEKLRQPHDYPMPSFAGYRPRCSRGCLLEQVDLPALHPFLSTAQAITSRYAEDRKE